MVLKYAGLTRFILPMPFALAYPPALILERLPQNMFTLTRAQVRFMLQLSIGRDTHSESDQIAQLQKDNIIDPSPDRGANSPSFSVLLDKHGNTKLSSVNDILPTYL